MASTALNEEKWGAAGIWDSQPAAGELVAPFPYLKLAAYFPPGDDSPMSHFAISADVADTIDEIQADVVFDDSYAEAAEAIVYPKDFRGRTERLLRRAPRPHIVVGVPTRIKGGLSPTVTDLLRKTTTEWDVDWGLIRLVTPLHKGNFYTLATPYPYGEVTMDINNAVYTVPAGALLTAGLRIALVHTAREADMRSMLE